jgi:hypothetical protein
MDGLRAFAGTTALSMVSLAGRTKPWSTEQRLNTVLGKQLQALKCELTVMDTGAGRSP